MDEKPQLLTFEVQALDKVIKVPSVVSYRLDATGLSLNAGDNWHHFPAGQYRRFVSYPDGKKRRPKK